MHLPNVLLNLDNRDEFFALIPMKLIPDRLLIS